MLNSEEVGEMVYIIKFYNSKVDSWWFCAREFDSEDEATEHAKHKLGTEHVYDDYQIYKAAQI